MIVDLTVVDLVAPMVERCCRGLLLYVLLAPCLVLDPNSEGFVLLVMDHKVFGWIVDY